MNRREALKGLGLSLGYVMAVPTVMSLLQSCKTDVVSWAPIFLSTDESIVIKNLVDTMLPKTEASPGALDVNVPEFIDLYASKALNSDDKIRYKEGIHAVIEALQVSTNKSVSQLNTEDYDALLSKYLRASKESKESFEANKNDKLVFNTLIELRGTSVWAYRTSQKIGEEVLAYDPIPGVQLGCVSLEEVTDGKRWSL